jgi:hypothetical protein
VFEKILTKEVLTLLWELLQTTMGSFLRVFGKVSLATGAVGAVGGFFMTLGNEINGNYSRERADWDEWFGGYPGPIENSLFNGLACGAVGAAAPSIVLASPLIYTAVRLTERKPRSVGTTDHPPNIPS